MWDGKSHGGMEITKSDIKILYYANKWLCEAYKLSDKYSWFRFSAFSYSVEFMC